MHKVSYGHSASLMAFNQENLQEDEAKKSLVSFAPGFDQDMKRRVFSYYSKHKDEIDSIFVNELNETPFMKTLAKNVADQFDGDLYGDFKATEENFVHNIGGYSIIHIGTHSALDDTDPFNSYIAFAKDLKKPATDNGYLRTYELYNLETKADLVVLTGCETGFGKIQRGEGSISLARGFSYAGSPSILMSLWKIDDARTETLVSNFYSEIHQGSDKRDALHQAKMDMIKNPLVAHPYFWSGMVLIGDTEKITFPPKSFWCKVFP